MILWVILAENKKHVFFNERYIEYAFDTLGKMARSIEKLLKNIIPI